MRKTLCTIACLLAISLIGSPLAEARGRQQSENKKQTTEQKHQNAPRPNNGNHKPNNNNHRPNNGHSKPNQTHRPPQRPPQNNHGRPAPSVSHRPAHRPAVAPPPPHRPSHPSRPLMPINRPWHRPTPPPPTFRPAPNWPRFGTILGIALGSAINASVNSLINNGYNVSGYNNEAVYLTNTMMLNMLWPDATLYYNNGGLCGSEFVYSTSMYDLNRYNITYNTLVRSYGAPMGVRKNGKSITSTWWGPNNQFITLSFVSGRAFNGSNRFFTTLSFGN